VELGKYYRIVGHNSAGTPLPPQLWVPRRVIRSLHTAVAAYEGILYLKVGTFIIHYDNHQIPFFEVNLIPQTEEWHDIHLEFRATDQATIQWVLGDDAYPEIARHARNLNKPLNLWDKYAG
jgi:hypothetical protein